MGKFVITFEGLLMDPHTTKLGLADDVEYRSSSTLAARAAGVGSKLHTVIAEAESQTAATEAVARALGADASKFHNWRVEQA
jgi:hypothetical protein